MLSIWTLGLIHLWETKNVKLRKEQNIKTVRVQ